ncbi:MAG: Helix-turn-helix domain [Neobacillus sp.]|jgi:transcriptional regulator with XRE-family HTH domain|nr:Helix-turn-helix domain [Neobacillus sp.]
MLQPFPDYLRELREAKNYSIRRLALRSKVAASSISRLENGIFQPSMTMLKKLSIGLNIPEQQLYYAAGYVDHPYKEVDVEGLPKVDVEFMDEKFHRLNRKKRE